MKRKRCYKCKKQRLVKFFSKRLASLDGLQKACKDCANIRNKRFYLENKKYYTQRYLYNRDDILAKNKQWNQNNKEKIKEHKDKFLNNNPEYYSQYRQLNKEILNNKARIRNNLRLKTDILFKLKKNYRTRLYDYYRGKNRSKRSEEIVGLSWEKFKIYLETKFLVGMTWANYGEWHIDHVIPLCSANNQKELEKLFHYTNCQPLWAKDNLSKGDKVIS